MAKSESTKIEFGYFHDYESEQFAFYRIPKVLFTSGAAPAALVLFKVRMSRLTVLHKWAYSNRI